MLTYYYNGNILTMDRANPRAPHMLVSAGHILFCSESRAPFGLDYRDSGFLHTRQELTGQVRFVDLKGKTVIPGICDAHAHFLMWGLSLTDAELYNSTSEAHGVELVKKHAANVPVGEWIIGRGWTHNLWDSPVLPSRESLDRAFPDNPVVLASKCGHLAWVNSRALQMAGIPDTAADPEGGEFERANGRITGILKENAMDAVHDLLGDPTPRQRRAALQMAQERAHAFGITGMQTPEDLDTWEFMQAAHAENLLSMRVNFWMPVRALDDLVDARIRHGLGDHRLRISAIKIFADGSLGGRTADMYDPYENEPDNYGVVVTDEETMTEATLKANRAGLSMAIHAIGDRSVGSVISAYEKAAAELGTAGDTRTNPVLRNRIEHLQVYNDRDLDRIKALKPIASIQPIHLCADMGPADRYWGSRSKNAYACRTVADAGCLLAFGSDVPVESCNPFWGMYAATTRNDLTGKPGNGWYPGECISLQETLEAYTINTAIASGEQDMLGSLTAGKLADFVVLPEDPFTMSPENLRDMLPLATYSEGKCVYSHPDWEEQA